MKYILRSKKHKDLIHTLIGRSPEADTDEYSVVKEESNKSPFPTVRALQCYAALLGFEKNRRELFDRKNSDSIRWSVFENDRSTQYIYLIGLAHEKDINILKHEPNVDNNSDKDDDIIRTFEEYAEGGFNTLRRWLKETPDDPFGTQAILNGLQKDGFLAAPKKEEYFSPVEF